MRGILYTRHDGGVSVTYPTPEIFRVMRHGGSWNDRPRGFVEVQIERQIGAGIYPDHARRFAHAVAFGGCTEPEVWDIIKDRDCARHGTAHELIDPLDLPDRWFREAWARSHNGGPVYIHLTKARQVQWSKLKAAVEEERKRRDRDLYGEPLDIDWSLLKSAIKRARDEDELRRCWPPQLTDFPIGI